MGSEIVAIDNMLPIEAYMAGLLGGGIVAGSALITLARGLVWKARGEYSSLDASVISVVRGPYGEWKYVYVYVRDHQGPLTVRYACFSDLLVRPDLRKPLFLPCLTDILLAGPKLPDLRAQVAEVCRNSRDCLVLALRTMAADGQDFRATEMTSLMKSIYRLLSVREAAMYIRLPRALELPFVFIDFFAVSLTREDWRAELLKSYKLVGKRRMAPFFYSGDSLGAIKAGGEEILKWYALDLIEILRGAKVAGTEEHMLPYLGELNPWLLSRLVDKYAPNGPLSIQLREVLRGAGEESLVIARPAIAVLEAIEIL